MMSPGIKRLFDLLDRKDELLVAMTKRAEAAEALAKSSAVLSLHAEVIRNAQQTGLPNAEREAAIAEVINAVVADRVLAAMLPYCVAAQAATSIDPLWVNAANPRIPLRSDELSPVYNSPQRFGEMSRALVNAEARAERAEAALAALEERP